MKCIKVLATNDIVRCDTSKADGLVKKGYATFSTKGAWKAAGRHYL